MLRSKLEDALPVLAHFQNGCPEKKMPKKQKWKFPYLNILLSKIYTIYL